jgi:transketolase
VLSAGHGSMLLYALLHLTGSKAMTIGQILELPSARLADTGPPGMGPHAGRRDHDRTAGPGPGHLCRHGDRRAAHGARFGADLVDHRTWVVAGDGCLMEGVSHEAISLAGRLRLSKLTVLWDATTYTTTAPWRSRTPPTSPPASRRPGWAVKAHRRP